MKNNLPNSQNILDTVIVLRQRIQLSGHSSLCNYADIM